MSWGQWQTFRNRPLRLPVATVPPDMVVVSSTSVCPLCDGPTTSQPTSSKSHARRTSWTSRLLRLSAAAQVEVKLISLRRTRNEQRRTGITHDANDAPWPAEQAMRQRHSDSRTAAEAGKGRRGHSRPAGAHAPVNGRRGRPPQDRVTNVLLRLAARSTALDAAAPRAWRRAVQVKQDAPLHHR